MLAIPLPFVAALLLFITAVLLRYRYPTNKPKTVLVYYVVCGDDYCCWVALDV